MPSHAYFYATDAQPDWEAQTAPVDTPADAAERERIAQAILIGMPSVTRSGFGDGHEWIDLICPAFEITVHTGFVHLRLRWRTQAEMRERGLPGRLRELAAVLQETAGYDFFEHGCQGLGARASIDGVLDAISPTTKQIRSAFGMS